MVGLVLVSHSMKLAEATVSMVRAMAGEEVPIAVAAGTGDDREELGTDAMEICQAVAQMLARKGNGGAVLIMDMGSAVISAEMALDFLDAEQRERVRLCSCAFVEGAIAAGVACKIGGEMNVVVGEAKRALAQKAGHLGDDADENIGNTGKEGQDVEETLTIPIPGGLHMRPVAALAQMAAKYQADVRIKNRTNGKGPASARSMTEILAVEALYGHSLHLTATGSDAADAVREIVQAIRAGLGDPLEAVEKPTAARHPAGKKRIPLGISRGIAIAPAHHLARQARTVPDESTEDPEKETKKLETALQEGKEELLQKSASARQENIFRAQATLLDDPALLERAKRHIIGEKQAAASAWNRCLTDTIAQYHNLSDPNLRQRTADLADVRDAVLDKLGVKPEKPEENGINSEVIIIAKDLTPKQVQALDGRFVKGVICTENAPTSHSAILLRARGIPSIVQAERADIPLENIAQGTILAMDGESGEICIHPDRTTLQRFADKQSCITAQKRIEEQNRLKPATTKDGKRITLLANVGRAGDSRAARENGAEGIGLLRTEFMFLDRETAPSEDEQMENLCGILQNMGNKPVVIRTLDAGGDKTIPYLDMPAEANPFLGVRAIRLCLRNRSMFRAQLRAILRAADAFDVSVMFPMVATMAELAEAKNELRLAHESLTGENVPHGWPLKTGIMVEVPSVAVMAEEFAREVDFFSIGTNDLIQYTLAADRGNPDLQATLGAGLDDSVRRMVRNVVLAAGKAGIPVSVCGEAAGDPALVPVLIGLGIDRLSMNASAIPRIKLLLGDVSA